MPSLNEMTPQQKVFCEEYLIDLNPSAAAIRAGYPADKAAYAARTVMKHPPVAAHIAKLMAARSKRTGLTADRVLDRLGAIVMGDPRSIFNEHGGLRKPHEMNPDDALLLCGVKTRRTISQEVQEDGSIKMVPEEIVEIKTVDLLGAMSLAMKHLGMMNDKLDINVTHNLAERLSHAQARIAKARGGVVIDGEIEEDTTAALAALEAQEEEITQHLLSAEPPKLKLEDLF